MDELSATFTYTVLDIETSGLSAAHMSEVIEVAAYHTDGKIILDSFHEYIKPWKPVPAATTKINHITNDMLQDKENKWKVLPRLRTFIGNSILVAHNAPFDFNFLNIEFFNMNLPLMTSYICTQANFKKIAPGEKFNLSSVTEYYGVSLENAHCALDDTKATVEIFLKMNNSNNLDIVRLTEKEALINILKRLVKGAPHKVQTNILTDIPEKGKETSLSNDDIIRLFNSGKTPNDICSQYENDYYETALFFISWINNIRIAKFYNLMNDKKIIREVKAMINVSNDFDDLLKLHESIYGKTNYNLSVYALFWASLRNQDNMSYKYEDFEWHFFQRKTVVDIAKEFSISPFLVCDNFIKFAENNKDDFRDYISRHLCLRSELISVLKGIEFINILNFYPKEIEIKKYISKKLYEDSFFKIKLV